MSNITIENLCFDAQLDHDAMALITGGLGWRSVKKAYRKVKKSATRVRRGYHSYAPKVGYGVATAPVRGARRVGNYFSSAYRNSPSVRGWFS